jgi:hypothetical protein
VRVVVADQKVKDGGVQQTLQIDDRGSRDVAQQIKTLLQRRPTFSLVFALGHNPQRLASGAVENHPESQACLATFPIRVEAGVISVELLPIVREETSAASSERADRPVRWVQRKSPAISGVSGATIEWC